MERCSVPFIRFLVASTFLFSGFVKLVDPLGTSYKIQEYFGVFGWEILLPFSFFFASFFIFLEFILGIFLFLGIRKKITLNGMLFINILFLFLTFYSAYFNKVTDCGCFGDALKLSPWETFYKNIILTIAAVFLFWKRKFILPILKKKWSERIFVMLFLASLYIFFWGKFHLPIIDFRAYAVGNNIQKGIENQKIHDFFLESNLTGEDLTSTILNHEKVILIVAYDLENSEKKGFLKIKKTIEKYRKKNYLIYGVSASSTKKIKNLQNKYALNLEFLFCDGTTLKTMIRSHPGIIELSKGNIIQKWAWRDL